MMKENSKTAVPQTTVNFYILADSDLSNRLLFVCRLVEKAFANKAPTLVLAQDIQQLKHLDNHIWAFQNTGFIPHEMISSTLKPPIPPVLLTDDLSHLDRVDFEPQIVIDLTDDAVILPFAKVMLVANQYQDVLSNARAKYQAYVNHGIQPLVHKIGAN